MADSNCVVYGPRSYICRVCSDGAGPVWDSRARLVELSDITSAEAKPIADYDCLVYEPRSYL